MIDLFPDLKQFMYLAALAIVESKVARSLFEHSKVFYATLISYSQQDIGAKRMSFERKSPTYLVWYRRKKKHKSGTSCRIDKCLESFS